MKKLKKTRIIATIGPATNNPDILAKLSKEGMNVARVNFSHEKGKSAKPIFENIKRAEKKSQKTISILQDLGGPKIRTGEFENGETVLKKNSTVKIYTKKVLGNNKEFTINYKNLFKDLKKGQRILLNDGKQELKVTKVSKDSLEAKVVYGGFVRSKRGVNLPDSELSISSLTKKDKLDLEFGLKMGVDFVALSFVKTPKDIIDLRKILNKHKSKAMIVSKIETPQAIANFDQILEYTDAVMVARGDLAVEVGPERVPMLQKEMIRKCNAVGKPVIVATQMLESMIKSPVATRAEVSDVSNAILDGADAVMLSEETAMGQYPLETLKVMRKVAQEVESKFRYDKFLTREYFSDSLSLSKTVNSVSRYAAKTASDIGAKNIVVFSETGATSRMVARFKPEQNIVLITPNKETARQSQITFGVHYRGFYFCKSVEGAINASRKVLLEKKIAKKGEKVVLVVGLPFGQVGSSNTISVFEV
ncbi:pyruvate kinase [Candidatus Campbellbacteria bacterium]|nr:MAG: pyruvate kinase [Candidatus Campbellbacteria bacterium]